MPVLPSSLAYGRVTGRIILAVADSNDVDALPDAQAAQGTVTFTPKDVEIRLGPPEPVTVVKQPVICTLDSEGYLVDPEGQRGVWLVTGVYTVAYKVGKAPLPTHTILVNAAHTETNPLDLSVAMPPGGTVVKASEYAVLSSRIDSLVPDANVSALIDNAPVLRGTPGKKYRVISAVLRNYGPPNYWQPITSSPHTPTGIASVTSGQYTITVNYDFTASKVGAFCVTSDETNTLRRITPGASVGVSQSIIKISQDRSMGGYIYYDAANSTWKVNNIPFGTVMPTLAFSNGKLTITHSEISGNLATAQPRYTSGAPRYKLELGTVGLTETEIWILNNDTGAPVTTPAADMKIYWSRSEPAGLTRVDTNFDDGHSNLWVIGIFPVD